MTAAKMMALSAAIIAFFIFTSFWGFYISVRPPKIISGVTPADLNLEYENVSFSTADDLTLRGWFIPVKSGNAKTIILLHGYPADKGDILPAMVFLNRAYNLFLFDFRYLGASDGRYSTAGAKEVEDLLAALRFLRARGIKEVGVWGFSMGGAVALMAAPQAPEIKAVVSESAYARLDLLAQGLYRIPMLKYPLGAMTLAWAKIILGIDAKDVAPHASAEKISIPVLLIHSRNDDVIPFEHAIGLQEAMSKNSRAEFWFEDNLAHGRLGEEYEKRIDEFFAKNM